MSGRDRASSQALGKGKAARIDWQFLAFTKPDSAEADTEMG
jgi:hypothetical protein